MPITELLIYDPQKTGGTENNWLHYHGNSIAAAAPILGKYPVGKVVMNIAPQPGGYQGWICTTAGTPEVWLGVGLNLSIILP